MYKLIEHDDHWELDIVGGEVTRCCVGYLFEIEVSWPGRLVKVKIGAEFQLVKGEVSHTLDPEMSDPAELLPALRLFRCKVASAIVWKAGSLHLEFSDGSTVKVDPLPKCEAWEIVGDDGLLMVCPRGGGPSVVRLPEDDLRG